MRTARGLRSFSWEPVLHRRFCLLVNRPHLSTTSHTGRHLDVKKGQEP